MKKILLCMVLLVAVILMGCENIDVSKLSDSDLERISDKLVVCEQPYIRFGASCCLDQDNNKICDRDEESVDVKTAEIEEEVPIEEPIIEPKKVGYSENSEEWQNVYSRALYYSILNQTLENLFKNEQNNLYYANKLPVSNFILINTKDSYDAVSVAPYAVLTKSYVLFIDEESAGSVIDFLNSRQVDTLLIYGTIEGYITQKLETFNPKIISLNGKFENNVEIVKRYMKINPVQQIILTNGEFLEREIMSGVEPVLFIGAQNVPDIVRNFIKESGINISILIGNDLIGTATFIRRQLGISVFVKFAGGARGNDPTAESRDLYNLPVYKALLEIKSVEFDELTSEFKVTFSNPTADVEYLKGTYSLTSSDSRMQTVGDAVIIKISANDVATITYSTESIPYDDIKAEVYVIFGKSEDALENELHDTFCSTCDRQVE
jgi:hypothetical protein